MDFLNKNILIIHNNFSNKIYQSNKNLINIKEALKAI